MKTIIVKVPSNVSIHGEKDDDEDCYSYSDSEKELRSENSWSDLSPQFHDIPPPKFSLVVAFLRRLHGIVVMDKSVRVKWSPDAIKCFLEASIQEVNKVGRRGSSLQRKSWHEVRRKLDQVCNVKVTQKQMRNLYGYLKERYAAWLYLREKSGDLYDPRTNTFNFAPQEWEELLMGHPKVLSLKKSQLAFPDLCAALFEGIVATGVNRAPSTGAQRLHTSSSSSNSQNIQPLQMVPIPCENENTNGQDSQSRASGSSLNSEGSRETTSNFDEGNAELNELMSKALKAIAESTKGPSIKDCVDKLNKIGLENTSPTYLAAFGIFAHSIASREAWLLLPSDVEVLKAWITMMGRSLGLLK